MKELGGLEQMEVVRFWLLFEINSRLSQASLSLIHYTAGRRSIYRLTCILIILLIAIKSLTTVNGEKKEAYERLYLCLSKGDFFSVLLTVNKPVKGLNCV